VTFHSRLASLEHFSVELIDKKSTPVELIAVALIIDNTALERVAFKLCLNTSILRA
jgi:hypothetical protein